MSKKSRMNKRFHNAARRVSPDKFCSKCGKTVHCNLVTGKEIYPNRPDLAEHKFWQCPTCKNYCKYGTLQVSIPTPELRIARRKIHAVIDPIWKSGMMSRGYIYKRMSEIAGYTFHNGTLTDLKEAEKMFNAACKVREEVILKYHERGGV